MKLLYAFLVGGSICALAQIIMDTFKLLPIHITLLYVCLGSILDIGNLYDRLIDFAGSGASLPISSFGHSIVHSALEKANDLGALGIFVGVFDKTASGITAAIVFAFFIALIFKPKG